VLTAFARVIDAPSRFEAFKAWQTSVRDALPYSHTRLATLTVKPAGSPDGAPVELPWSFAEDWPSNTWNSSTAHRRARKSREING
jgi:hypothetical protein